MISKRQKTNITKPEEAILNILHRPEIEIIIVTLFNIFRQGKLKHLNSNSYEPNRKSEELL